MIPFSFLIVVLSETGNRMQNIKFLFCQNKSLESDIL